MKGSSYIPLPDNILRKKAIINIQNKKHNKKMLYVGNIKVFKSS